MPIYPLPHASWHGLGVHVAPTTAGTVLLGPTIGYQDRKDDYEGNRLPLASFLEPARALLPDVQADDLKLGSSGIRAKFHPPSESFADFYFARDSRVPGLIHAAARFIRPLCRSVCGFLRTAAVGGAGTRVSSGLPRGVWGEMWIFQTHWVAALLPTLGNSLSPRTF